MTHSTNNDRNERPGDWGTYEYGPETDFDISYSGDMARYNGSYEETAPNDRYLIQALCHAVYQVRNDIAAELGDGTTVLRLKGGTVLMAMHLGDRDDYSLFTGDGMTAFHIIHTGRHSFEVEFVSPSQLRKAGPLIDYAFRHALTNGREI